MDIERLAERLYELFDELHASADEVLERVEVALAVAEQRLLAGVSGELAGVLPATFAGMTLDERVAWYLENSPDADQLLRESGYYAVVAEYVSAFDGLAAAAYALAAAAGVEGFPGGAPQAFLDFVKQREYAHLAFLGQEASMRVADVVSSMTLGGSSAVALMDALRGAITGDYAWGQGRGLYSWHAGTYVRTELMRVIREFVAAQADRDGVSLFMYVGPLDSKTRPFCARVMLGKMVYSREEIDSMDNGQTGDVMTDGGGYNCRHSWMPVTAEFAAAVAGAPEVVRDAARNSTVEEGD